MADYDDMTLARVLAAHEQRGSNKAIRAVLFNARLEAKAWHCRDALKAARARAAELEPLVARARDEMAEQARMARATASLDVPMMLWGFDADAPDEPDAVPHVVFLGQDWIGLFQCLRVVPAGCQHTDLGGGWSLVVAEWFGNAPLWHRTRAVAEVAEVARERLGVSPPESSGADDPR